MRHALLVGGLLFASPLFAQEEAPQPEVKPEAAKAQNHSPDVPHPATATPLPPDKAEEEETLDEYTAGLDPLAFTQKEQQTAFPGGIALNIGPVMPWSQYGASLFWSRYGFIQSLSLGAGDFKFSDNYKERNYRVQTDSQSVYYAARWFFLGFGPLYLEPFVGFVRWSGSIKPNGYDNVNDSLASSLNSRFDISGASLGGNLGLMWIFSNGLFLDYNLLNISGATFISKTFTTNTDEAKKNVKKELGEPLTMSNLHLRIGYSIAL